ncbi:MAG TPA: manganese ABC transporter ATP-binding protein [Bacteroidetes bacterium]|jgi:manganese/zinc/iron transport system ATP- binding protein|nr:MAG: manganese ABC transporter ATP-binding protein [Sphingobacteriales bacterium BACL12 MAG-120802-bin5]KRP13256.1 MAG: manganese ABC transporter ATP-binding protein [Sphingobacteriales bacterium BACL12 MAG-120813-bin55]HCK23039.1 manganese ABC transporter ATP-binding protein [Bacteroidota bacterium]
MTIRAEHPVIEAHDLTVSYQRKPALWGVDFSLPAGVLTGIIGPNGAGKSTLIKAIMGLAHPDSGYVRILGRPIDEVREKVAYVPQRGSVDWDFPASVLDVVLMGRYRKRGLLRKLHAADKELAFHCLEKVGMQDFIKRQISQLSGGQQQRVFIARALAQQAEVYLMDEPFAGIDATTEQTIFELLGEMRKEGKSIVVVHHDLQSAYKYFDWIILLNTQLIGSGPKSDIFIPEFLRKTYGGKLNMLTSVGELMAELEAPLREKN